jgi:hypothetical protein
LAGLPCPIGQLELDLGLEAGSGGPLPITSSRMGHLLDALEHAYRVLGFEKAAGGDAVFRQLVLARIIEPVSKLDSLRVLEEAGLPGICYRTVERRLPAYAEEAWRQRLSAACAAHARPAWSCTTCPPCISRPTGRRLPRARFLQGTAAGAADHHRPADRAGRVPADGQRF